MRLISGNKIGTIVNVMVDGVMHRKDCGTEENAKQFFQQIIETKKNPSDENVDKLYLFLSKNFRIARKGGFEFDPTTGNTYMENFNTPVPDDLMITIDEYLENGYPMESIKNFWKLLMANPDKRIRNDLFDFIKTHDFSITDKGYMVVYKTVDYKSKLGNDLASFVSNNYLKIKTKWKKSPRNYVVYEETSIDEQDSVKTTLSSYKVTETKKFNTLTLSSNKSFKLIGNLNTLQENIHKISTTKKSIFTDKHSHSMRIVLGEPVRLERTKCDGDPKHDCSYGLHVGATKYVENFRGFGESPVLVCLVNPMHVVAVPQYDHSKMRVCEYFPFAHGTVNNDEKIEIIEKPYFENDYINHEEKELKELLSLNKDDIRKTAKNTTSDDRDIDEYLNILESRVVDLGI